MAVMYNIKILLCARHSFKCLMYLKSYYSSDAIIPILKMDELKKNDVTCPEFKQLARGKADIPN